MNILTETKISMYQTCLNVSGDNYQGSKQPPVKILATADKLFAHFEIKMGLVPIKKKVGRTTKKVSNKKARQILNRIAAKKGKK